MSLFLIDLLISVEALDEETAIASLEDVFGDEPVREYLIIGKPEEDTEGDYVHRVLAVVEAEREEDIDDVIEDLCAYPAVSGWDWTGDSEADAVDSTGVDLQELLKNVTEEDEEDEEEESA